MKNFTLPAILLFSAATLVSCSTDSEGIDDTSALVNLTKTTLFTGSNTSGKINMFDTSDMNNVTNKSFQSSSRDSDGIHYDPINDCLFEASRSDSDVLVFENLNNNQSGASLAPSLRSDVKIENPRDIAVSGNRIVVSSDATNPGDSNKFFVYESTPNSIRLVNVYETGNQHWGIFLQGNTLYAAVDNSNKIAVYNDFFSNASGELTADDVIGIQGAKSLRGVTYDQTEDRLFLADVVNPLNDSDGAIHTIDNFSVIYSGMNAYGVITSNNIKTVTGSNTMLGNPVDLEYDNVNKVLYVAERSTNGGMAIAFDNFSNGGNMTPRMQQSVSGISSIHLNVE
jgi:6-phosphogluconolactonase (cycloisomerase 2 family)